MGAAAFAADEPANIVKYRKAFMDANGAHITMIAAVVKGEVSLWRHRHERSGAGRAGQAPDRQPEAAVPRRHGQGRDRGKVLGPCRRSGRSGASSSRRRRSSRRRAPSSRRWRRAATWPRSARPWARSASRVAAPVTRLSARSRTRPSPRPGRRPRLRRPGPGATRRLRSRTPAGTPAGARFSLRSPPGCAPRCSRGAGRSRACRAGRRRRAG